MANRQGACASRKPAGEQKRAAGATLVLPITAVPRDEMPPHRVRSSSKRK